MIMENKIVIQNFGPVKEAQINLNKNFQIFIGAQASGKSTICKVVYFVQKIRDYTCQPRRTKTCSKNIGG